MDLVSKVTTRVCRVVMFPGDGQSFMKRFETEDIEQGQRLTAGYLQRKQTRASAIGAAGLVRIDLQVSDGNTESQQHAVDLSHASFGAS